MDKNSLINGVVIDISIGQFTQQDYIEIELEDGQIIIITASSGGCLKIGLKLETL